ncbi:cell surface glycoprotein MUC18 [Genypterus blacodes]|uniref:cell surface glycoprotein MUC18 n=1 Tax=Genypterus blacodes TaxID=154954 RepID=UPI003F768A22
MASTHRTFPLLLFLCTLSCTAWAKVELTKQESVEVFLGKSAEISVHYRITGPDYTAGVIIQWHVRTLGNNTIQRLYYSDDSLQMVDNNTDYSSRINVRSDHQETVLTISDVQLSDERVFFCQINAKFAGSAEGKTLLRVFAPPAAPVIEGVLTGISVTNEGPSKVASCEARNGYPTPNITWYRNSTSLMTTPGKVNVLNVVTRESNGFYSVQSTLEYNVVKEDKDAYFSCEVSYFVPSAVRTVESKRINVSVHYHTTMVALWKESPKKGLVKEGDNVELRCQGDGNPPPSFIFNKEQEMQVLNSSDDRLILTAVSRKDSGIYQCRPLEAESNTKVKGEMQLIVHYLDPATVIPKDLEVMSKGENLTATCNALSSLKTSTNWYKNGKSVGEGNRLLLQDASYETTGEYVCEVTLLSLPALRTQGSVHIIVKGGPELVGVGQELELELEESVGGVVNLSCEAHGHPLPTITWDIVGSQTWYEVVKRADDLSAQSVVSVRVTSDTRALCNVSNDLGSETRLFSIKAVPLASTIAPFSSAEGSELIIVMIILCLLLLVILGSVLYFLHKKGTIHCGRSGKQYITKENGAKEDIVMEMKTNPKAEDAVLLQVVKADKKDSNDQ